jgi:peptide deformylase
MGLVGMFCMFYTVIPLTLFFFRAISAPQIGKNERVIAMNLSDQRGTFLLVNPQIIWRSEGTFSLWDDCFSFPWLMVRVRRHDSISVIFKDHLGQEVFWGKVDRALSELLQHEIDHLDGVLSVDRQEGSNALVSRRVYLANQSKFNAEVDYAIATLTPV